MADWTALVTYILIPGADGRSWYWNRIEPLLREAGHEVVTSREVAEMLEGRG